MGTMRVTVVQAAPPVMFRLREGDERPTVRCPYCNRVQFSKDTRPRCLVCGKVLKVEDPDPEPLAIAGAAEPLEFGLKLAKRIRDVRIAVGLSQPDLAERMGSVRTHVSKLERKLAGPVIGTFSRMTEALGVSAEMFLDFDIPAREVAKYAVCRGADAFLSEIIEALPAMGFGERNALLCAAQKFAAKGSSRLPF